MRGALVVRGDAAATAANILAKEGLYRAGLGADLVMLAAYVAVTAIFYLLFKAVNQMLSLTAALFSVVGIAVLAVNSLHYVAPLVLLRRSGADDLAVVTLEMHARGYDIAIVFFGIYCVALGYLILQSGFLPRFLGVLMSIGGAGYMITSLPALVAPAVAARVPDVAILGGIAELVLSLWLTVKGVKGTTE